MKGNKGITLIALVVTIIVLLILAAVAIAMLTGDNSILRRAQSSQAYTAIGAAKDEVNLAFNAAFAEYLKAKYETDNTTDASTVKFATYFNKTLQKASDLTDGRDSSVGDTKITPTTVSDTGNTVIYINFHDKQNDKYYETSATVTTTIGSEKLSGWSSVNENASKR